MATGDYPNQYQEGYAAGYAKGYQDGIATNTYQIKTPSWPKPPYPNDWMKWPNSSSCRVCGMVFELGKAYGFVCGNSNCPSKVISSTTASNVPDGLSYEEIYGSVVYQQNKKKE